MRNSISGAVSQFKRGGVVIILDDKRRENEGDFVVAAQKVTPETIRFMATEGRGLICVALLPERLSQLGLLPMVTVNTARLKTAFTVSCDARVGTTTGISAFDRAATVKALLDPKTKPEDLLRPGHMFPLAAKLGGVRERQGHTEAAVDLARLSGLYPAGVLCEIIGKSGKMARSRELKAIAKKFRLPMITIAELVRFRKEEVLRGNLTGSVTLSLSKGLRRQSMGSFVLAQDDSKKEALDDILARGTLPHISRIAETTLPTAYGTFRAIGYEGEDGMQHLALVRGDVSNGLVPLVRLHSRCATGDVFGSLRCDCGKQLERALKQIGSSKAGVLVYLNQEGRGIGFANKLRAYALQDRGLDTVEANHVLGFPADAREYETAAAILNDLGVRHGRMLTNNPGKISALSKLGVIVTQRLPLLIKPNGHNQKYLKTKQKKLGHLLS